jgi:hypothetical protein
MKWPVRFRAIGASNGASPIKPAVSVAFAGFAMISLLEITPVGRL